MAYKMIKDWESPDGNEHEITVYKYNLSHDEMVRYYKSKSMDAVEIRIYPIGNQLPTEYYEVK